MRDTLEPLPPASRGDQAQDWRRRHTRTSTFRLSKSAIFVGLGLLLLIVAIPAYTYYQTYIAPLEEIVVRVNDTRFNLGDYTKRLRYLEMEGAITGIKVDYSIDPFRLLQDLQSSELIRQASPRLGVTMSEAEVDQALKERLNALPKEGEQVTPEELERTFRENYRQRLAQLKLSDAEYRRIVEEGVRKDKMRELLSVRVPAVAEQVRVLGLKVEDPNAAEKVQKRLEKGEDLGALARELSTDPETKDNRGDLGWVPRRAMDTQFDQVVFATPVGGTTQPFFLERGFWIVKVLEHADARRVEGAAREKLKDRALQDWLLEEQKANQVESFFDSERYALVVDKAREYRQR